MDLVTELLSKLRTKGESFGRLDLGGAYSLAFPWEVGHFFIVTRGRCFLEFEDGGLSTLDQGDFVFLPSRRPFSVRSSAAPQSPRRFSEDEARVYRTTQRMVVGDGQGVTLLSGCFQMASPETHFLLDHLPPLLGLPGPEALPWGPTLVAVVAREIEDQGLGARVTLDRLAEVLLIQTLRHYFQEGCHAQGPSWIRALADPRIGRALEVVHTAPGHPWTVDELATEVGMSRSSFALRFKELVGCTPWDHLTRWRMTRAASLLAGAQPPKLEILASSLGYESESSFRKAFRKVLGVSPSQYREGESARLEAQGHPVLADDQPGLVVSS